MSMNATSEFDVVVIGGGPAGSTLSTIVARAGHRVLLLDRDEFPRFQIGESLLPSTVRQVADVLGVRERIREAGFVVKRGATFSWGTRPDTLWTLNFGRIPADQVDLPPDAPTSFNVPRHRFDQILIENTIANRVDVRTRCTVTDVISDDGRVTGVRYTDADGGTHQVRARYVAITSGQSGLTPRMLGQREYSTFFRKIAVFGYFNGAGRLPHPLGGNVFFETVGDAWLWYIPLSDRLTSIGAVVPFRDAAEIRKDPPKSLANLIDGCPIIAGMMRDATPCTEAPFDQTRMRSEYSYCTTKFWSPGVVAVGDAACFVDVLLSSGVHLATYGALLAARSINSVLDGHVGEAHAMNEFESRMRLEYATFYRGLVGLYDMTADSDTYAHWLRSLLQDTNGVFVEWREQTSGGAMPRANAVDGAALSEQNVEAMRAYNAWQVRYAGGAEMTLNDPPPPCPNTLSASSDWLRWNSPVPAPEHPMAPDPEVAESSATALMPQLQR